MKHIFFLILLFFFGGDLLTYGQQVPISSSTNNSSNIVAVSLNGNSYITNNRRGARISDDGITRWQNAETTISAWFKVTRTGLLDLAIRANVLNGKSKIQVKVEGKTFDVNITSKELSVIYVGSINIAKPGYIRIDFQGLEKEGEVYANISELIIAGEAASEPLFFVRDFSTYWGRRGPSVHMKYPFPENTDIEYFYNEVTVPGGNDVIGSYFMANGFDGGYFGMQVNSPTERRVLFSVWSPYNTQNPKDIPAEYQIKCLKQGEGVHIGEFGNEGSGGQSYLRYQWKAGETYKFVTHIRPDGKGNTVFTAYFYAADESRWRLIASFLRPKTDNWYKGAHSFLENFSPDQGYLTRKVLFSNQWAVTTKGKWIELTKGGFTYDATARAKVRQDYQGGVSDNSFYLQNCGFFNENTEYGSKFSRKATNKKPTVNLKSLSKIKSVK